VSRRATRTAARRRSRRCSPGSPTSDRRHAVTQPARSHRRPTA
jgi:hypothetical protein